MIAASIKTNLLTRVNRYIGFGLHTEPLKLLTMGQKIEKFGNKSGLLLLFYIVINELEPQLGVPLTLPLHPALASQHGQRVKIFLYQLELSLHDKPDDAAKISELVMSLEGQPLK